MDMVHVFTPNQANTLTDKVTTERLGTGQGENEQLRNNMICGAR